MSQIKIKYVGIDFFKDSSFNEDFIKNECYKIFLLSFLLNKTIILNSSINKRNKKVSFEK